MPLRHFSNTSHLSFQNLQIQDLREQSLDLHRDIASSMRALGVDSEQVEDYMLADGVPLFPEKIGEPGYLGDNSILGKVENYVSIVWKVWRPLILKLS